MARTTAAAVLAVLALSACAEPEVPDGPVEDTGTSPAPDAAQQEVPGVDALDGQLAALAEALEAASGHLDAAAGADDTSRSRAAARRALGVLLEDAGTASTGPLLPATTPERGATADRDDLLSATLAGARDVGGDTGTAVVALLRDGVGGDLGAWERDAAGMVERVEGVAATPGGLERRTERILELPGEATRALAWTFVATEADDLTTASTAAERAASHLELVRSSLAALRGDLPDDGGDA